MKPTNVRIYGQHFMEPKNMNLDMYKSDEIFLELIFYDLRILPQYYISNYGRLYSMRIPGCKGKQRYSPEDTIEICKYLSDGKIYRIDELCDIMKIKLEDRKLFRNHIDDIIKGNCDTHITKQYSNLRRPLNVKKNDKNYYYYN